MAPGKPPGELTLKIKAINAAEPNLSIGAIAARLGCSYKRVQRILVFAPNKPNKPKKLYPSQGTLKKAKHKDDDSGPVVNVKPERKLLEGGDPLLVRLRTLHKERV